MKSESDAQEEEVANEASEEAGSDDDEIAQL